LFLGASKKLSSRIPGFVREVVPIAAVTAVPEPAGDQCYDFVNIFVKQN
jgi:hypothetical protein